MTDQEAALLIEEFRVPQHVRRHCRAVADFAVELGKKLIAAGEKVNIDLLRRAALVHDFVRVVDFKKFDPASFPDPANKEDIRFWLELRKKYTGLHHAEAGARILEERGFNDIATLVRKHRFLQIKEGFINWEEKLLYYADKRTKHDQVVPLRERLDDGRRRNAPETQKASEAEELNVKVLELEEEILSKINKRPPSKKAPL